MNRVFEDLPQKLKNEGLQVRLVKGWKGRGRDGTWEPKGVMFHHTASNPKGGNAPALGIVTHGRSDLPGPLSNFVVGRDGTIFFVAAGRCNHAGEGGPLRGIPKDSGNAYLIGMECENNGIGEKWNDKQLRAIAILSAVLLERMDEPVKRLVGHKEWTNRKIDPANVVMWRFRLRVKGLRSKV